MLADINTAQLTSGIFFHKSDHNQGEWDSALYTCKSTATAHKTHFGTCILY
jgi:hypothetical protein